MTPLILVILAVMWAAVLLPPYLRDRSETKAATNRSPVRQRLEALTSSLPGSRSHLPVHGSGQSASEVPLPAGARHPVGGPGLVDTGADRVPQSSAVQVLGPAGGSDNRAPSPVTRLHTATAPTTTAPAPVATDGGTEARARQSGSSFARRRRRDVLHLLLGLAGITLMAAIALGGPLLYLHLLVDVVLIGFVYLLVQRQKAHAEREIKVAFLPHGGTGASATALLEQGGGWNPGTRDNLRVLRAEAN